MQTDPNNVQYNVMAEAIKHVAQHNKWNLNDVCVWVSAARLQCAQSSPPMPLCFCGQFWFRALARPSCVICALAPSLLRSQSVAQADYSSIPQKHKASQLAAINSLALYASIANALIVAVPEAEHVSTKLPAGAESYQKRAWCRAEQFCYSISHGTNNLWVASSPDPAEIKLADSNWLETCLFVFEGEQQHARLPCLFVRMDAQQSWCP